MSVFPVVLVGRAYWQGLVDWLRSPMAAEGKVDQEDLELFHVTDDPDEVVRIIQEAKQQGTSNRVG
jgi:predicted Rossmann-fold nucleotide-binding protein